MQLCLFQHQILFAYPKCHIIALQVVHNFRWLSFPFPKVVPVPSSKAEKTKEAFYEMGELKNVDFTELPEDKDLREVRHTLRPGLQDIGLLFTTDSFPESGTKTLRSMSVYKKRGKQPSDTISCENNLITSTIFVVFFAYLTSNWSISFALKSSHY